MTSNFNHRRHRSSSVFSGGRREEGTLSRAVYQLDDSAWMSEENTGQAVGYAIAKELRYAEDSFLLPQAHIRP